MKGKHLNANCLACGRVIVGESERFRINSGVRQGCIMSPWLFNVYMSTVIKRGKNGDGVEGREWILLLLLCR